MRRTERVVAMLVLSIASSVVRKVRLGVAEIPSAKRFEMTCSEFKL